MLISTTRAVCIALTVAPLLLLGGCGGGEGAGGTPASETAAGVPTAPPVTSPASPPTADASPAVAAAPPAVPAMPTPPATPTPPAPAAPPPAPVKLPSISLGAVPTASAAPATAGAAASPGVNAAGPAATKGDRERVMAAMKPIQTVLGSWEGKTQKNVGDFKGLDAPTWVWDHKTDRNQPALVMKSDKNRYFREARLTYLAGIDKFQLATTDADGHKRVFEGTFTLPVEEYQGDDNRPHKRFKIELTEVTPVDVRNSWQIVLNQQDNNRYLFELAEKKGMRFLRFDTLANQRSGTSFAMNDSDYKERTCVISGGLGTTAVTFGGKTYYVCCSGCKAAFDDEPARWVAEFEAKQKTKAVQ